MSNMPADESTPTPVKPFTEQSILWPLTTGFTILYLGMMIVDFALRDRFTMPSGMMLVYTALLAAYAGDKELRRWMGSKLPSRWGAFFIYAWFIFFGVAYIIRAIFPSFELPADLAKVCLQVLGIFFGTKASSKLYSSKQGKEGASADITSDDGKVLQILNERGKVTNEEVEKLLTCSHSTAFRILNKLKTAGKIKQEGVGRGIYYVGV